MPETPQCSEEFPFALNTGRTRDQWHTMTRTGQVPRLLKHEPEPELLVNRLDLRRQGIADGALLKVRSSFGETLIRARASDEVRAGNTFASMHWTDQFSSAGAIDCLVNPNADPYSGQPELKFTPITLAPFQLAWSALIVARDPLPRSFCDQWDYWTFHPGPEVAIHYLADSKPLGTTPKEWLRAALDGSGHWFEQTEAGFTRCAQTIDGRLQTYTEIFTSTEKKPAVGRSATSLSWLQKMFALPKLDIGEQQVLFAGPAAEALRNHVICSCFSIDRQTVEQAVAVSQLQSTQAIGHHLRAGTNCGSCKPELQQIIVKYQRGVN